MSSALFDIPSEPDLSPPESAAVVPKATERGVLDLLHARYDVASQGDSIRYAVAEHVRSSASFDARRVCDFMAQDLWRTGRLELHGHEVKVSRSDWLRELADPSKADAFKRYCDRWWLVVSDQAIVKPGELPDGWGLMVAANGVVRVKRTAPTLTPEPHPPTFRAALLRATAKTNARQGRIVRDAQRGEREAMAYAIRCRDELAALRRSKP